MEAVSIGTLVALASSVTVLGGAYLTVRKIQSDLKKEREEERAKVLQEAKEEINLVKVRLETQVEALKNEVDNFKDNVDKDFSHMRETYNGEIRFLGQKIEELRSEVRNQHGQLVQLLSRMIENRE